MMWGTLVPLLPTVLRHWWGFSRLGGVVLSGHMCMMLDMTSTHEPQPIKPADMKVGMTIVRSHGKSAWDGTHIFLTAVEHGRDPLGRTRVSGATMTGDVFTARLRDDDDTWVEIFRPLDQAPAVDPAIDAHNFLRSMIPAPVDLDEQDHRADVAVDLIREALADRITQQEADALHALLVQNKVGHRLPELTGKLARIGDRDDEAGR